MEVDVTIDYDFEVEVEISDATVELEFNLCDTGIESIVAGTNVTVDNTDPDNPVISVDLDDVGFWEDDGEDVIKPKDGKTVDASHISNLPDGSSWEDDGEDAIKLKESKELNLFDDINLGVKESVEVVRNFDEVSDKGDYSAFEYFKSSVDIPVEDQIIVDYIKELILKWEDDDKWDIYFDEDGSEFGFIIYGLEYIDTFGSGEFLKINHLGNDYNAEIVSIYYYEADVGTQWGFYIEIQIKDDLGNIIDTSVFTGDPTINFTLKETLAKINDIYYEDIKDTPELFSGSYNDLDDVPSEFPPSSHSHSISDVTDLQTGLDGKLNLDQTSKQTLTTSPIINNLTAGRIPFSDSDKSLTDDSDLCWDNVNKRLGIGTITPEQGFHMVGGRMIVDNSNIGITDGVGTAIRTENTRTTSITTSGNQFLQGGFFRIDSDCAVGASTNLIVRGIQGAAWLQSGTGNALQLGGLTFPIYNVLGSTRTLTDAMGIRTSYNHRSAGSTTNVYGLMYEGLRTTAGTGTITNHYGLFLDFADLCPYITNKWGLYLKGCVDTKNYIQGSLGVNNLTPDEAVDVDGNIKATGFKTGTETGQTSTITNVVDTRMNNGQLQKKTQTLTFTNGLLTTTGEISDWTDTTDV